MLTVNINDKDYNFVFNSNTSELYYQTFGEDLFELTIKLKDDNQLILKRNRLQKLAYIANQQASKSVRELAGHMNLTTYLMWSEQFDGREFLTGPAAAQIIDAWRGSFETKAEEKNQISPQ